MTLSAVYAWVSVDYLASLHISDCRIGMPTRSVAKSLVSASGSRLAPLRITVTVDGHRWRQVTGVETMRMVGPEDRVFIVNEQAGTVQFGNGIQGARPPDGSVVRVRYREGSGAAGTVLLSWEGRWPPRASILTGALAPTCMRRRRRAGR
jgi:hypothetical protein